jgi:aspartate aminotransferase
MMEYSHRVASLEPSATLQLTAKAKELQKQGRSIISLSAGQPDFPSPRAAVEAAVRAMRDGHTGYTATPGIPELRDAVARATSARRRIPFKPANVIVSCGAKHSIANLLFAAVNPGDGVLMPRPYWVSYPEMVKLAGGQPLFPAGGGMLVTAADVREAAARGAKGVILNSPGNPTGLVAAAEEMRDLALAILETGIWAISDDIYEDLVYLSSGAPHILDYAPALAERSAIVSGVSKTFAMTGWRIGWAVGPEGWVKLANRVQEHTTSNPTSIAQWASLAVVAGGAEQEKAEMLTAFHRRRDLICDLLSAGPGLEFTRPEGAFYVFPSLSSATPVDSAALCDRLLEEAGLAVVPGSAFGAEGFLRLSFAASDADIREGVARLGAHLGKWRA